MVVIGLGFAKSKRKVKKKKKREGRRVEARESSVVIGGGKERFYARSEAPSQPVVERSSSYDPTEDYTPSPEEEQLETLKGKNIELEWKNAKLQEDLERLQREYLRDRKKLNLLEAENGGLMDSSRSL
ncbi:hypothetical protein L6452_01309 [Arctium lappa]|uniref:Uncharacterized protein n=1 Tax=Arctium lappa TaxID=4217 RepID=A0ACB9FH82_ARCLA|nr:hypothetical protein L6452_01309 [Arctium lappa]